MSEDQTSMDWLEQSSSTLFDHRPSGWPSRFQSVLLTGMYLLGLGLWWYFLNGGNINFNLHDWVEAGHRYAFLQEAVRNTRLPLHMPGDWALRGVTTRFLSVVDTNLSPQVLLLGIVDLGQFVMLNTLILYSVGFAGLVLLRNKYKLSPAATGVLFLLLFFNGHVTSHLAVGHTHWAAYLLTPFILHSALSASETERRWRWAAWTALLLFAIFLQGAFHLFVITLLFLGLLALAIPDNFNSIALAGLMGLSASAVRILPALLDYKKFDTGFFTGFPTTHDLLEGLLTLNPPLSDFAYSHLPSNPLGWWEFDYYVGPIAVAAILYVVLKKSPERPGRFARLMVPGAVLTVLSIGRVYDLIHFLNIPLFASQRVSSRLFIIPFILVLGLATIRWQELLNGYPLKSWQRVASLGIILLIANDLWQHFKAWRVTNMDSLFSPADVDLSRNVIVERVDPTYEGLFALGALITICTLIALLLLIVKGSGKRRSSPA